MSRARFEETAKGPEDKVLLTAGMERYLANQAAERAARLVPPTKVQRFVRWFKGEPSHA